MKGMVEPISRMTAVRFLLPRHYSGRNPSISYAFGWYIDDHLVAVCTFGKPASATLCSGVCGEEYSKNVYELNRLCRIDELQEQLSGFVGACLRRLRSDHLIIVSFSDTGMNHHGYIYQACNFYYTGITKERTDKYTPGNKHSRHYEGIDQGSARKVRTAKHRYIFFATKNKYEKKEWLSKLNYPILPYPKGVNSYYNLGEYYKTEIIGDPPPEKEKPQIEMEFSKEDNG